MSNVVCLHFYRVLGPGSWLFFGCLVAMAIPYTSLLHLYLLGKLDRYPTRLMVMIMT